MREGLNLYLQWPTVIDVTQIHKHTQTDTLLACPCVALANNDVIPPIRPGQLPLPYPGSGEQLALFCRVWRPHHPPHAAPAVLRRQVRE